MVGFAVRRLISLIFALLLISVAVFIVLRVIPGDPAQVILGVNASPHSLATIRKQLGLNDPLPVQYGKWLVNALQGDLGRSVVYHTSVSSLIASRLSVTLPLAFLAMTMAVLMGLPLGIIAAIFRGRWPDYGLVTLSQLGICIPAFWLGIMLLLFFSVRLGWFPAGGFTEWVENPVRAIQSLILPIIALGVVRMAAIARLARAQTLEMLSEDYVNFARSKGLPEGKVIYKHVVKNSFIALLTLIGLQLGQLLAGAVIIENVFYLPGLGRLLFLAIEGRDLPLVQGIVVMLAGGIVTINFLVDMAYGWIDPRIKFG